MSRLLLLTSLLLGSCVSSATTTVTGDAFAFNEGTDARVVNAHVFILEDPSLDATTDSMGHFVIAGVPVGSDVTLVLEHPEFIPIQTGTHVAPATGIDRITFQAVKPIIRL